jgi:hypothetical protein
LSQGPGTGLIGAGEAGGRGHLAVLHAAAGVAAAGVAFLDADADAVVVRVGAVDGGVDQPVDVVLEEVAVLRAVGHREDLGAEAAGVDDGLLGLGRVGGHGVELELLDGAAGELTGGLEARVAGGLAGVEQGVDDQGVEALAVALGELLALLDLAVLELREEELVGLGEGQADGGVGKVGGVARGAGDLKALGFGETRGDAACEGGSVGAGDGGVGRGRARRRKRRGGRSGGCGDGRWVGGEVALGGVGVDEALGGGGEGGDAGGFGGGAAADGATGVLLREEDAEDVVLVVLGALEEVPEVGVADVAGLGALEELAVLGVGLGELAGDGEGFGLALEGEELGDPGVGDGGPGTGEGDGEGDEHAADDDGRHGGNEEAVKTHASLLLCVDLGCGSLERLNGWGVSLA